MSEHLGLNGIGRVPRASDERFPQELRALNDNPTKRLNFRTIACSMPNCSHKAELLDNTRAGLPEEVIAKKFQQMGWAVGKKANRDLCPDCAKPGRKRADLGRITFGASADPTPPSEPDEPPAAPPPAVVAPVVAAAPKERTKEELTTLIREPVDELARRLLGEERFRAVMAARKNKVIRKDNLRAIGYTSRASADQSARNFGGQWFGFWLRAGDFELIPLPGGRWSFVLNEDVIRAKLEADGAPPAENAPEDAPKVPPLPTTLRAEQREWVEDEPAPPRAPQPAPSGPHATQVARRRIREALEVHYDDANERYRGEYDDKRLARELDLPWAWVREVRDAGGYGPDVNESEVEMKVLMRDAIQLRADIEAHAIRGLELDERAQRLQRRVADLSARKTR